ncbi:Asp-tRNA(Asn)/Glu-tRNA(Gln) amidotransferase subunit GatA [Patescibacteria group bacterium]|nr:Asp-tRNA(Asn)/Glu-tRNA(Gln) amidotransferase subunit GatA [Patescibacteria group bacterium]
MRNLNELTLLEAIDGLKKREFTSVELTNACLRQIKNQDSQIKALITTLEEKALEDAEQADRAIKSEGAVVFEKKPLLGIPYVCKDNFSTKGIRTTAGSKVLENYIPPFESTVTGKIKEAGAILLGKTNMDAFAHGSSTENSDFFTTRNPWDVKRVPGGSSGGSAAAVSTNMCLFAIGSETGGSIRGPASWCGVTGLKPSYGRVSRYGVVAMASSTDSPGPISKTVEDSAYILNVIAGKDSKDATSSHENFENFLPTVNKKNLDGVKIGKPKSYFEIDIEPGVAENLERAIQKLKEMGAEIIELDLIDPKYSIAVYTILQRSEVSSNLARFDGIRFGNDRTNFGFEAKKRIMLGTYTLSSGYYDAYYSKAQKVRTLIKNDFEKAFQNVDVLVAPSMPCIAPKIGESDKFPMFGELIDLLNEPSAVAGLPGITVPCGISEGMPVGAQFIGNFNCEDKIIYVSNLFQKETDFHKIGPKL